MYLLRLFAEVPFAHKYLCLRTISGHAHNIKSFYESKSVMLGECLFCIKIKFGLKQKIRHLGTTRFCEIWFLKFNLHSIT